MAFKDIDLTEKTRSALTTYIKDIRQLDINYLDKAFDHPELNNPWMRTGITYMIQLRGLQHFFQYISQLPSHTVLDIGAGATKGIREISQAPMVTENNLEIHPTVMSFHPIIDRFWGRKNLHVTSIEILKGIPDNSIGGILGAYSIRYSEFPGLVARSLKRVLIPGGIAKFDIDVEELAIYRALLENDFEIASLTNAIDPQSEKPHYQTTLLIRKHGGTSSIPLETLLRNDAISLKQQIKEFPTSQTS